MDADAALINLRRCAGALVDDAAASTQSRMLAYSSVARRVGVTAEWMRRFVAGSDAAKEPRWTIGQRIIAEFDRLCDRIEADAALRHQSALELRRKILVADMAASGCAGDVVGGVAGRELREGRVA